MKFDVTGDGWIALIGIIVGFFGVYKTIKKSEEQFKDDKRISVKPYPDIKLKCCYDKVDSIGTFFINRLGNLNLHNRANRVIEITNLGQGYCLECKLTEIRINGKKVNDKKIYIGNIENKKNI